MKQSLITFLFLFSAVIHSKDLLLIPESNPDVEKCIEHIITNPLVQNKFPELLTNQKDEIGYQFLVEVDSYCTCSVERRKEEINLKKTDSIAWHFRDKAPGMSALDQCTLAHFSNNNIRLIYDLMVATKMRRALEGKISGRMLAGVRQFASTRSIQNKNLCLQAKILKKCTKIKSLRSTYDCIQEVTSSVYQMQVIEKLCPSLSSDEDDLDLTNSGDII